MLNAAVKFSEAPEALKHLANFKTVGSHQTKLMNFCLGHALPDEPAPS